LLWLILAAAILAALVGQGVYAVYALVWSAPAIVKPPPLPEFGQKSQAALPEPNASPPLPAQRPTAPTPSAGDTAARTDRVRRFVEQYSVGNCFFILPVAISSNAAVIEGFGASTAPFDALDKAFKRDLGFEASIGARLVTQAQCPAIKFLGEHSSNQARTPRINLNSIEVKNGETLSGTIENFANRVVELLLVSDSGEVQNLSYLLKPGIDSLSFSIGMQRSGGGDGPQLVMAVTTPQLLASLRQPKPTAADTFFLQAVSEAQRNNVAIATAARYFRLKN
jgi:serine/threonine-protein kinase